MSGSIARPDWIDYDRHARTRPRDDLWGQVRRTVDGQPVGQDQIDRILAAITDHLALGPNDLLLDLACGNGALSAPLFAACAGGIGVDSSEYLIGIARERFATPTQAFHHQDAAGWAEQASSPPAFTKALCYGSLSYLTDDDVARMLSAIHHRMPTITRILLGNLPDPARASAFYRGRAIPSLDEPRSDLGAWRTPEAIARLAGSAWHAQPFLMEPGFFARHYRFDLVLSRLP